MFPSLFKIVLVAVVLFAILRGGRDERAVALLCLAGTAGTFLVLSPLGDRFANIEIGVFAIDLVLLCGFVAVALRSCRFWPLWVAGLQLTTLCGHVFKTINIDLLPQAYAAALYFWSYPILLILAVGTWRGYKRRKAERLDFDSLGTARAC